MLNILMHSILTTRSNISECTADSSSQMFISSFANLKLVVLLLYCTCNREVGRILDLEMFLSFGIVLYCVPFKKCKGNALLDVLQAIEKAFRK